MKRWARIVEELVEFVETAEAPTDADTESLMEVVGARCAECCEVYAVRREMTGMVAQLTMV